MNSTEYVLLKAIIFCYPAVQNLSEKAQKLLRKQQETYALILLRHLQARHGDIAGAKQYSDQQKRAIPSTSGRMESNIIGYSKGPCGIDAPKNEGRYQG
uniref:Uncharacterized protein n=1 Tax=Acrobeloides nanus TaxID=290746 RepID=A0A914DXY9_9BILA